MIFKCKMCGGDLEIKENSTVCECEYCGTKQTIPLMDNEKKVTLFRRANRLRFSNEFDEAAVVYGSIAAEYPSESEAYWGLCLCKYGIEYVDDPITAKKVPTCHRTHNKSIFDDDDFQSALDCSDGTSEEIYKNEAKEIDRLQKENIAISSKEDPYDIFICYKEKSDEDGQRTKDSVRAQDIYDKLTQKGYKVFFSRITLEDKLGQEYEPYIYSALNSAKVMLCVGTKAEHFEAVWVKNEWNRFLNMMKRNKDKSLIPCYEDMDAYDMPKEFRFLQGQDMSKVGFLQDLLRGIEKIIPLKQLSVSNSNNSPKSQSIIKFCKCNGCGSIMPAKVNSCSCCSSQNLETVTADEAYRHLLNLAEKYSEYSVILEEAEEMFKKNKMAKDFKYYHLRFINITSSSKLYDCYSFDRPDAVECINKAMMSASGEDKNILKELIKNLNEKSIEERRTTVMDSLETLKKGKEKVYGYAEDIYGKEIKSIISLPISYYDFVNEANKPEEELIKSKRSHVGKYFNELTNLKRELNTNKQKREQALYAVEQSENSAQKLEIFHKFVIWVILIIGYIIIDNAMPNGSNWFGVAVGWTIFVAIVKLALYFVQNNMDKNSVNQRREIDARHNLSAADILVLERYYNDFENSIINYNEQIKKDDSIYLQNKSNRELVRKLCADTYLDCFSVDEINHYLDIFKNKMEYNDFIDKYSTYKKTILKAQESFKKNFPKSQVPGLNKIEKLLPVLKPAFSPSLYGKDRSILHPECKNTVFQSKRDDVHDFVRILEEDKKIKSDLSRYNDRI